MVARACNILQNILGIPMKKVKKAPADGRQALVTPQTDLTSQIAGDDAYLEALGQRVRRIRALRGMSRKVLAQVSGISERYIAQLESGQGNVSIMLLRRIGQATGVPVEEIVTEEHEVWPEIRDQLRLAPEEILNEVRKLLHHMTGTVSHKEHKRIALIGLRGAGKSTLGQMAAKTLGSDFVELNRDIENEQGFSVTEIFKLYGQEGYRRMEFSAIRRIAESNRPMIVATGGGIVAEAASFDFLLKSFYTIWIKAKPEEHMRRVRKQGDLRPMANDRAAMKELVTILTSREPLYGRANAIVDTSGKSPEASLQDLLSAIHAAQ